MIDSDSDTSDQDLSTGKNLVTCPPPDQLPLTPTIAKLVALRRLIRTDSDTTLDGDPSIHRQSHHILRAVAQIRSALPPENQSVGTLAEIDPLRLRKVTEGMRDARRYSIKVLQDDIHPFLLKQIVPRAINQKNVQLINVSPSSTILDFRATAAPLKVSKNTTGEIEPVATSSAPLDPSQSHQVSLSKTTQPGHSHRHKRNRKANFHRPPNEFDWCAASKLGRVLSVSAVCELFSMIETAKCGKRLKEVYVNAKRHTYFACTAPALTALTTTLSELRSLHTIVLRGMCDDKMLQVIGKNLHQLKRLDVSGSQFVTDAGLQHLFFKDANQNSNAFYLMSTWVLKNADKMNALVNTLKYLDCSFTSVKSGGRKMVQLLSGSYQFKRLMSKADQDAMGHYIFIKEPACLQDIIPSEVGSLNYHNFEMLMSQFVGTKGVKHFSTIVENHPWRNCLFTMHSQDKHPKGNSNKIDTDLIFTPDDTYYAIITPNKHEKRIQGLIYWELGLITHLYSIYPININALGSLNFLKSFRGIIVDTWKVVSSLLPDLAEVEIFTEPATLVSILEFCPNLKKLHVRIRKVNLMDEHLVKAIQNSMCRQSLEDVWIAPDGSSRNSTPVYKGEMGDTADSPLRDLTQLSMDSLDAVIKVCPKLKRIGDVSLWRDVEVEELYIYCEELKLKNSNVSVVWSNLTLPDYAKRRPMSNKN